jgi:hypothetical protein
MQISKGNLFWGFPLEACPTWLPSHQSTIIMPTYSKTCQELICAWWSNLKLLLPLTMAPNPSVVCVWLFWCFKLTDSFGSSQNFQGQRTASSVFLRKTQIENHQLRVFQRHQRTARFHERTGKEPAVRKAGSWIFQKFWELRFYTKKPISKNFTPARVSGVCMQVDS